MSINSFQCRVCGVALRLDENWPVHRAKQRHYICNDCLQAASSPRIPKGQGYLYLIANDNHPGRYKIGRSRNPEMRCSIFNTSCPDRKFRVVDSWYSEDYKDFEGTVHKTLHDYRLPGTEWFEGDGENFRSLINVLHRRSGACAG